MSVELDQRGAKTNQHETSKDGDNALVERVWRELEGQVARDRVSRVIAEVGIAYQDAQVQVFVPILIHRQALERLKAYLKKENYAAADLKPSDGP